MITQVLYLYYNTCGEVYLINYKKSEKEFNKYLDGIDVVSFDIFDTLLIRPYKKPVDLFKHLEILYNAPGFCNERIFAEARARTKCGSRDKDICFNDIYDSILPDYKVLKEKELELEKNILKANPFILNIYKNAVKKGKQIIAISDMYLPESFLKEILSLNGFNEISQIYVSSKYGYNKNSRVLYQLALKDLKISPERALHIGDNLTADFYRAKECGMNAILIPQISANTIWKKRLKKINNQFETGILSSIFNYHQMYKSNNYWEELGYHLGGPLAVGYIEKIISESSKINLDTLLFVSRDGYILQKVYNILAQNPLENRYIYAPRILNLKCFLDYRNSRGYLKDIFALTQHIVPEFKTFPESFEIAEEIFEQNKNKLKEYSINNQKEYLKYINSLNLTGTKIASVDMTTGAFSSLYFLKHIFGEKLLLGFYNCFFSYATEHPAISYYEKVLGEEDTPVINLTEFLITSPEPPLENIIDCKPVYKDSTKYDDIRSRVYNDIAKGILDFTKDYQNFFKNSPVYLSSDSIFEFLTEFLNTMSTKDHRYLKNIYHAEDTRNNKFKSITRLNHFKHKYRQLRKEYVDFKINIKRALKYCIYKYTSKRFQKRKGS